MDLSISAQLNALREYAAKNEHSIIRELVDEAESGTRPARLRFRETIFLAKRRPKTFDAILSGALAL